MMHWRTVVLGVSITALADPVRAACPLLTPASGAPSVLWGELSPLDKGQLPANRDSTDFNGFQFPNSKYPLWVDIDHAGSYLFLTTTFGFQVWQPTSAGNPKPLLTVSGWKKGATPEWVPQGEATNFPMKAGAAAKVEKDGYVYVGVGLAGTIIWRWNPGSPLKVLYQHPLAASGRDAYVMSSGSRWYAYTAGGPLRAYDITRANDFSACVENQTSPTTCKGVFLGSLPGNTASVAGVDDIIATALPWGNIRLFRAIDPAKPTLLVTSPPSLTNVGDVAMWQANGKTLLAAVTHNPYEMLIYDVSACETPAGCTSSVFKPLFKKKLESPVGSVKLTYSVQGARRFLHHASGVHCLSGPREHLFDVTDLTKIRDVSPRHTTTIQVQSKPVTVDYWGYYYPDGAGFSLVSAHGALFVGDDLYRIAYTLFDVHQTHWAQPTDGGADANDVDAGTDASDANVGVPGRVDSGSRDASSSDAGPEPSGTGTRPSSDGGGCNCTLGGADARRDNPAWASLLIFGLLVSQRRKVRSPT